MSLLLLDDIKIINFLYAEFLLNGSSYLNTIIYGNLKEKIYIFNAFNKNNLYAI